VARARRRWVREQGLLDPARLVFIDETAISTNMVRPNGWNPRGVDGLERCVRSFIRALNPSDCIGYFRHARYEPQ